MEWLQLVYRIPAEPSRKRTAVWRQIRSMGAVYLQDGCCVLPRSPEAERGLVEVANKVRDFGGEATLSAISPAEPGWEERLIALVNRARDEEYEELADTAERLVEEVARESRKGKFTFAALEEVDGEYERLERWLARIQGRDAFAAAGRDQALGKLSEAKVALDTFAEEVQRREGVPAVEGVFPTPDGGDHLSGGR